MKLIGTVEAGKRLGLTRQGVHKRIRKGQLEATMVGRDWLITEESIKRENIRIARLRRRKGKLN